MTGTRSACIEVPTSSSPRVSVIIPATASQDLLLAALQSLARHGPPRIPFEVIVVLNRSSPAAAADLSARVMGVRVVPSAVNLGLAGAANRGRTEATGELLIILHDDAEVEPGWMEALVTAADSHPEAGVIGGKVLHPDGTLQNAGMILWRDASSSPPWSGDPPPPTAFDDVRCVDYCGTSSLLVRADVWDAVGGLDERFYPLYYVDVDLAMSVRRLGLVVLYEPASRIRHHSGASSSVRWRSFVLARNRRLFVEKWAGVLDQHEPCDVRDMAATARAMARTARRDRPDGRVAAAAPLPQPEVAELPPPDGCYIEMERDVTDAYVQWLTATLDNVEHQLGLAAAASPPVDGHRT